ncbi:hypothetical protein AWC38_SpisGene23752 [Stylophora pistillata]|uniref:Uncharacterized protein n=1 Tax=Stylophora pistillata TaxID=50429 RepID=A0A2B4R678_STYPI|nr:hypothetical protein AWC38_SpisGene23752 [Stylophora pistillata]
MLTAWLRSDEAKRIAEKKRTKAWNDFKAEYPNADLTKFTGLNNSTLLSGALLQAVEFLVNYLTWFQNRSNRFCSITFISQPEEFFLRWVESALPGDTTFSQMKNNYDQPSFRRLCSEFGISSSTDFRFKEGRNHGLGSVFIYVTNAGSMATAIPYPGDNKLSDEGGKAANGNLIYFIRNDNVKVEKQFEFFMADKSEGLAQAGMARLNQ